MRNWYRRGAYAVDRWRQRRQRAFRRFFGLTVVCGMPEACGVVSMSCRRIGQRTRFRQELDKLFDPTAEVGAQPIQVLSPHAGAVLVQEL